MLLLSCWVNRYCAIYRIYNSARTRLLSFLPYSAMFCRFCYILPTIVICGQYAVMYGNMPSAATRNVLLYSARVLLYPARVLLYSARVGLYRVGGMWWERVVVYKVSRGGPVTSSYFSRSRLSQWQWLTTKYYYFTKCTR